MANYQSIKLGIIAIANIASNFLFQWLILTRLGTGAVSDALFSSITVPQLFTAIISTSLTHVLVPIFVAVSHEDQKKDAWAIITYVSGIFTFISVILIAFAELWIPLMVPGFSQANIILAIEISKITLCSIIFSGILSVLIGVGYARGRYYWTELAPLVANSISAIMLVFLLPVYGVVAAAWIVVFRVILQCVFLLPMLGMPVIPDFRAKTVIIAWDRLKPIMIGASYYKMDPLVDRVLLSNSQSGSLSLLYLAQQLHSAGSQVVSKALAVPAITQLARAKNQKAEGKVFSNILVKNLMTMALLCGGAIILLLIMGEGLIGVGMVYGEFSSRNASDLWLLLLLSSGMFFCGSLGALTSGAFYSSGDTKTPTTLGVVAFTIGIFIKVIMYSQWGVVGLAVGISIYYMMSLLFHILALKKMKYIKFQY